MYPVSRLSAGLYVLPLSLYLFILTPRSNLTDDRETPGQKYTRGLIVGRTPKVHSDISPTVSLNFTRIKKLQIWPRFSTPVAFDGLWLQNGGTYRKPYTSCLPKFDVVLFPYLWKTGATLSSLPPKIYVMKIESPSSRSGHSPRKVCQRLDPRLSLKPRLRYLTYPSRNFTEGVKVRKFTKW